MYDKDFYLEAAKEAEFYPTHIAIGFWETRFTQEIAQLVRDAGYTVQVTKTNSEYYLTVNPLT